MNTKIDFGQLGDRLVYVKPVAVSDLPEEVQEKAEGLDQLFAVHDSDGQQLALVADRDLAFVLARQHDMSPVTVH
ncbi:DUF1150 family protein [Histidinibacterium aquaticum]|uniref:DUF1150 domain-containing protein n=1 Tax=Histidinibacterium aquaticum TaxID=2613962 RepID=A0A5J5GRS8_9RHOB|nr:DUF1150 family protein [Histidinibacterium aquaticum]KAA9010373.1 DUF1150 domain-containing protein [Histidinibacterium aquaticum]